MDPEPGQLALYRQMLGTGFVASPKLTAKVWTHKALAERARLERRLAKARNRPRLVKSA